MELGCVVFLLAFVLPTLGAHDLASKYTYRRVLNDDADGSYVLHWRFDISEETIYFAVNVSTTGWVGFGISPNGRMPGSDVVIGWVESDGTARFSDRFADEDDLPPIDRSQDWELLGAEEENGFTILEFMRPFTTCDERDLDIGSDTSRVVWSWSTVEPPQAGIAHDRRGELSLNLLGSLEMPPADPDDLESFDATVNNTIIPSASTTYWCASLELPADVQSKEKYITRISPVLTEHVRDYVHHILIHLCPQELSEAAIGVSAPCSQSVKEIQDCQAGLIFGGWAIGGEGFIFPDNVALPFGGPEALRTAVIEIHYDNPDLDENVIDSSGLRFYYSGTPREHRAGVLFLGHTVTEYMMIPPKVKSYTVAGLCHQNCTQSYLPEDGIKIFGNFLHTHLAGRGLKLEHFRWNAECDVWEELPPIDKNLLYDFNFQQFTHLGREVAVLPGDLIILKCFYNTAERDEVTTGGHSTREEMCLSFPVYYPEAQLDRCLSFPEVPGSFQRFIDDYLLTSPNATAMLSQRNLIGALNTLEWNTEQAEALQDTVLSSPLGVFCSAKNQDYMLIEDIPSLPIVDNCSFQGQDTCSTSKPLACCERLGNGTPSLSTALITLGVLAMLASAVL